MVTVSIEQDEKRRNGIKMGKKRKDKKFKKKKK